MADENARELTRDEKKRIYRREKCRRVAVNIFPPDMDLYDWITAQDEGQAAYIRRLVREDMERRTVEQSFDEASKREQNGCSDEGAPAL